MNLPDSTDPGAEIAAADAYAASSLVPFSSPVRLNAAAYLYGLRSVPIAKARVLELGCAQGQNLLPFALAYPDAEIVGVDMSDLHVQAARQRARALGATNVRFCVSDLTAIGPAFGEFDYIIAHGIYGRAATELTQAVLRICRQNLSALGIAYVNYRTYPGWKPHDIVRDAMLLHARSAASDTEVIGRVRAAAQLLFQHVPPDNATALALKTVAERAQAQSDEELASDYLLGGSACYFAEFASAAQQIHLVHVGDAEPQQEMASTYGMQASINHTLVALGQPTLMRQQYLDFMVGREHRRSMLAHEERAAEVLAAPDLGRLAELRLAGSYTRLRGELGAKAGALVYRSYSGKQIETQEASVAAVMDVLSYAWPASVTIDELVEYVPHIPYGTDTGAHRQAILKAVHALFNASALHYTLVAGPYDAIQGKGLMLIPGLAGAIGPAQTEAWRANWFNLWHEPVAAELSSAGAFLLPHIDGEHGFSQLAGLLCDALRSGQVKLKDDHGSVAGDDPEIAAGRLVLALVEQLRRQGAICGSHAAWVAYFQAAYGAEWGGHRDWLFHADALTWHVRRSNESARAGRQPDCGAKPRKSSAGVDAGMTRVERLMQAGDHAAAEPLARLLTVQSPHSGTAWWLLGDALRKLGRYEEALAALGHALARTPVDARVHTAIGFVLCRMDLAGEGEACYRRALLLDGDLLEANVNLGALLWEQRRRMDAEIFFHRALALDPGSGQIQSNLANALMARGEIVEAMALYRKALATRPNLFSAHSNLLFLLTHYDGISAAALFDAHRSFGLRAEEKAADAALPARVNTPIADRKLRLGFVSSDLYNHAVANFLEPVWRTLDREAFEIHVYSTTAFEDDVTRRLKTYAASWSKVTVMSDIELARRIREDSIDILFDLAGHSGDGRLAMYAFKPAPVQVSWIGYPATTGLVAMDYHLLNRHVAPPGYLDTQFTEKLVYLPSSVTFEPFAGSPAAGVLPALENGYLTFGSFNRVSKISDASMDIWGRVLRALPSSRMLLGGVAGDDEGRQRLIERFASQGVAPDRLIFRPRGSMREYLGFHCEVDILLDTYPYTGGTTTCHALWMGVPVLTLRGETRVSRQTAGMLAVVGLEDWISDSPDELVARAQGWEGRLAELSDLRASGRNRFMNSPFRVTGSVTRALERALRRMWRRWCDGLPPESFSVDDIAG